MHRPPEETIRENQKRHWLKRRGTRKTVRDYRLDAIDIYDHIDLKGLKEAYLACIPQLGI